MVFNRSLRSLSLAFVMTLVGENASAQTVTTNVFDTIVPFTYNRGRNESVTDRLRPDYQAIGIPIGGFTLFPTIGAQAGISTNVYQSQTNTISDEFVNFFPAAKITSNWAVNSLTLEANAHLKRYFAETPRNENAWAAAATGNFNLDPEKTLGFTVRTERYYESQFTGIAQDNLRTPIVAQATTAALKGETRMARFLGVLAGDWTTVNYFSAISRAGAVLNENDRDRNVARAVGHAEYGLTPDVGIFVETIGTFTNYRVPLANGDANRNSTDWRILTGVSLDLASKIRGSIGVGYIQRNYHAPIYIDLSGLALKAKLEYFPTQLTTVSLAARREIEDAIFAGTGGYFNTGAAVRVDHELLRNFLLNIGTDYELDNYRGISAKATVLKVSGGADYLVNHLFGLNIAVNYAHRGSDSALIGPALHEFRAMIGITIHR